MGMLGHKSFMARALGFILLAGAQPGPAGQVSKWEWDGVGRIVAIGDVHGSHDNLAALLRGAGLVDEGLRWSGGEAHLVLLGDLVDRGRDDRDVVELVIRLEDEARASGGHVHAVLGNHDIMVLMKDLRYVDKGSYADFAPDETPQDRQKGWEGYSSAYSSGGISEAKLKAAFDDTYPPGFFAYSRMFDLDGAFGAWCLTRPAAIKVNGIVFVHGGLTAEVAAGGLEAVNREVNGDIIDFAEAARALESLVKGPATFEDIVKTAYAIQKGAFAERTGARQDQASRKIIELQDSMLLAADGAVWYRANALENERLERQRIDAVLTQLKAKALVLGHTPTAEGLVTSRFNARVYRADVGLGYGRPPLCLEFGEKGVRVFNPQTAAYQNPFPESPQGQKWSNIHAQASDRQLEEFLKTAKVGAITSGKIQDRRVDLVELEKGGLQLRALFVSFDEKPPRGKRATEVRLRRYEHEVAAYWLDRRLKLRMVPVTVVRKIDGRNGALQVLIESAVDRVWVEEQKLLEKGRELLRDQIDNAWLLEALLDVEARVKEGQMVLIEERRIMLSGSTLAFSPFPEIQKDVSPHLHCPINPSLENELRTLTREELRQNLKDYLSEGQIEALLKRRDRILELCAQ